VVETALEIIDAAGPDALTLARVAERAGVATPSLYKHVNGLPALQQQVKLRVLGDVGEALRTATMGRAGEDALRALAAAYRDYLRTHPHRHPFVEVAPDDPDTTAAADRVVEVAAAVMSGYGLSGPDAIHAIRCLRAAVHGFARLEAIGGFGRPEDIDTTFSRLIDMVDRGLSAMAGIETEAPGTRPPVRVRPPGPGSRSRRSAGAAP
jgi:AcrR family transcriptional regulator